MKGFPIQVLSESGIRERRPKWEVPNTITELSEEIAFWKWALKYAKGTPKEDEYDYRLRACVRAKQIQNTSQERP